MYCSVVGHSAHDDGLETCNPPAMCLFCPIYLLASILFGLSVSCGLVRWALLSCLWCGLQVKWAWLTFRFHELLYLKNVKGERGEYSGNLGAGEEGEQETLAKLIPLNCTLSAVWAWGGTWVSTELGALSAFSWVWGGAKGLTSSATAKQEYAPKIHRFLWRQSLRGYQLRSLGYRKEEELIWQTYSLYSPFIKGNWYLLHIWGMHINTDIFLNNLNLY